jgi:hypothetical protein
MWQESLFYLNKLCRRRASKVVIRTYQQDNWHYILQIRNINLRVNHVASTEKETE